MTMVRSDGANLWYEVSGTGEPLTLIGGYALQHDQWDFINGHLAGDHRLVHWNPRGLGRSDWSYSAPFSVERWVDDLRAVLDDAGIERTAIWATSTGSAIGIRFASKYPERTSALITYPWYHADETWKDIFRVSAAVARVFGYFTLARVYTSVVLPPELLYDQVGIDFERYETEAFERNINPGTLDAVMEALCNVDLTADVARLKCPTLLLMGSDSRLNEDESLESASYEGLVGAFVALNPDAEVIAVPGAGSTYLMITKPAETAQIVTEYLSRVGAGAPAGVAG